MSLKNPSLFDDFFMEEEKNEELFPDVPHVYDHEENKVHHAEEDNLEADQLANNENNTKDSEDAGIEVEENLDKGKSIHVTDTTPIIDNEKENKQQYKKPTLELPEQADLDQQLLNEIISTDYASFIHRDYPFNPLEIEVVSTNSQNEEPRDQEVEIISEDIADAEIQVEHQVNNKNRAEVAEAEVVALPDWDLTKKYYPIGEVAKLFDVNISNIRFWTNEFKLNPRTTRKGDRLYTPTQIEELKLIHYLVKVKKHTIKGAIDKMKNQKETVGNNLKLKESLTELRDLLLDIHGSI